MGRDGVAPPESEDSSFTDYPAPTYGITTHILYNLYKYYIIIFKKLQKKNGLRNNILSPEKYSIGVEPIYIELQSTA